MGKALFGGVKPGFASVAYQSRLGRVSAPPISRAARQPKAAKIGTINDGMSTEDRMVLVFRGRLAPWRSGASVLQKPAGDDVGLDLGGALEDREDARVA